MSVGALALRRSSPSAHSESTKARCGLCGLSREFLESIVTKSLRDETHQHSVHRVVACAGVGTDYAPLVEVSAARVLLLNAESNPAAARQPQPAGPSEEAGLPTSCGGTERPLSINLMTRRSILLRLRCGVGM